MNAYDINKNGDDNPSKSRDLDQNLKALEKELQDEKAKLRAASEGMTGGNANRVKELEEAIQDFKEAA